MLELADGARPGAAVALGMKAPVFHLRRGNQVGDRNLRLRSQRGVQYGDSQHSKEST